MKLELTDINYNAIVVEVNNLVSVGLDTLVAFPVFGMQALVPKTTKTGSCFTSILNDCFLMNKYAPTINAEKKNR